MCHRTYINHDIKDDVDTLLILLLIADVMSCEIAYAPLLPSYDGRETLIAPVGAIHLPDALRQALAHNSMAPYDDTVANGNCGIHAFVPSAAF